MDLPAFLGNIATKVAGGFAKKAVDNVVSSAFGGSTKPKQAQIRPFDRRSSPVSKNVSQSRVQGREDITESARTYSSDSVARLAELHERNMRSFRTRTSSRLT